MHEADIVVSLQEAQKAQGSQYTVSGSWLCLWFKCLGGNKEDIDATVSDYSRHSRFIQSISVFKIMGI